jgi:hypothetical protein
MTDREYRSIDPELWNNGDFCLETVKQDGEALEYVPREFYSEALFLEAVRQNGFALAFVPKNLMTRAIIDSAVKQNRHALQHVPDIWRGEFT